MAKKVNKETNVTTDDTPVTETTVTESSLPTKAFSVIYKGNNKFSVVEIPFNPENNKVGELNVVKDNTDYYDAIDVFKRSVVRAGLFERR